MSRNSLIESARTTLEPTPAGALMRKRAVALTGLVLLFFGFLFALGLGALVLVLLLPLVAAACLVLLAPLVHRRGDIGRHVVRPVRALSRRARQGSKRRAPGRDALRQAARFNARGLELRRTGDFEEAIAAHTAALELVREVEDRDAEAMTLNNLALALGHAGDDEGALLRFEESAAILRAVGDEHHEGQVVANLGFLHARRGRREQALSCLEAALGKLDATSHAYRRVEEQLRRAS